MTVSKLFLFAMRKFLIMKRDLQNNCLILMMAIPCKKESVGLVCSVVFGMVSLSVFTLFSLYTL